MKVLRKLHLQNESVLAKDDMERLFGGAQSNINEGNSCYCSGSTDGSMFCNDNTNREPGCSCYGNQNNTNRVRNCTCGEVPESYF